MTAHSTAVHLDGEKKIILRMRTIVFHVVVFLLPNPLCEDGGGEEQAVNERQERGEEENVS